jgi:hypothetical protein
MNLSKKSTSTNTRNNQWFVKALLALPLAIAFFALPTYAQGCADCANLVTTKALQLNGGTIKGNVQQINSEFVNLNEGSTFDGSFLVPGSPFIIDNSPNLDPANIVCGASGEFVYGIALNGNINLTGKIVTGKTRDALAPVADVAAATGTQNVAINTVEEAAAFSANPASGNNLRDLFINVNVGEVTLQPQDATYGNIITTSGTTLVLGRAGETTTYNVEQIFVNTGSSVKILGSVTLRVRSQLFISSDAVVNALGTAADLKTEFPSSGQLIVNSGGTLYADVNAPSKQIFINFAARLIGAVKADQIFVNFGGYLESVGDCQATGGSSGGGGVVEDAN